MLLYRGFGQFIDSTRCVAIEPGTFSNPEIADLKEDVDKLMDAMCEVDDNELRKQEKAKGPYSEYFFWAPRQTSPIVSKMIIILHSPTDISYCLTVYHF